MNLDSLLSETAKYVSAADAALESYTGNEQPTTTATAKVDPTVYYVAAGIGVAVILGLWLAKR